MVLENTCQTNHKASWLLAQRLKFIIPTNLPPFTKISGEKDALHHRKQKCNNWVIFNIYMSIGASTLVRYYSTKFREKCMPFIEELAAAYIISFSQERPKFSHWRDDCLALFRIPHPWFNCFWQYPRNIQKSFHLLYRLFYESLSPK